MKHICKLETLAILLFLSFFSFVVLAPGLQVGGAVGEPPTRSAMSGTLEESGGVVPLLTGWASWYDYTLVINGTEKRWSKSHSTCALRIKERYKTYRVCSIKTSKCVDCYHNDYGPQERTDKVIDLSSYAFKQLGIPLKHGVAEVEIFAGD